MSEKFTFETAIQWGDVQRLRPLWEKWQNHPNTDFEHYQLVLSTRARDAAPYVVLAKVDDAPVGLLVGRTEPQEMSVKVGYANIKLGRARMLRIMTGGVLGAWWDELAAAAVEQLIASFQQGAFDAIIFSNVRTSTAFYRALQAQAGRSGPSVFLAPEPHWIMQIPPKNEELWMRLSSRHRSQLRKARKKLDEDEDIAGDVDYRHFHDGQNIEEFCKDAESVASKTYQHGLGIGFKNDEFYNKRCRLFASKGQFRGYVLYLNGVPRAFWMGCVYGDIFHSQDVGYDPQMKEFQLGSLLLVHVIEELIKEKNCQGLDFGLGDAEYKQRFSDQSWYDCDVTFYAPTLKNRAVVFLQRLADDIRKEAQKSVIGARIKRFWRDRAAKQAASEKPATPEKPNQPEKKN
jgi:CelD/BcsL family acetyltransferase involved in cellulose biosynthesis